MRAKPSRIVWPCRSGELCSPFTEFSDLGRIVMVEIETLANTYPMVRVGENVVMPNHVHMIIVIADWRPQVAPTVPRIIKQWKGRITKRAGFSPWQKSFHDHVIRNQDDYLRIAQYIENNPAQWELDSLNPAKNRIPP